MYRPSRIGLSVVKLKCVKKEGRSVRVYVTGSDLLDGTPIVDIKPYIHYSDAVIDAESGYAQDEPKRKSVIWSDRAIEQKQQLLTSGKLSVQTAQELEAVLSLDPRPAYQYDEARIYGMKFANLDVKFKVNETCVEIQEL
jgi:tRNA (adenine37-N6)-methyltransferase